MVAGADPVVVGGSVVGLVIGVSGGVVELAGLCVLAGGLGVEGGGGLTVESLEHLQSAAQVSQSYKTCANRAQARTYRARDEKGRREREEAREERGQEQMDGGIVK